MTLVASICAVSVWQNKSTDNDDRRCWYRLTSWLFCVPGAFHWHHYSMLHNLSALDPRARSAQQFLNINLSLTIWTSECLRRVGPVGVTNSMVIDLREKFALLQDEDLRVSLGSRGCCLLWVVFLWGKYVTYHSWLFSLELTLHVDITLRTVVLSLNDCYTNLIYSLSTFSLKK